jgi:hypothetical protein
MKLKSELYFQEQKNLEDKLIHILNLDNKNSITLYELDKDIDKQKKILDLIPEIQKYYSSSKIPGVYYYSTNRIVRPWLSIIKYLTKNKFEMCSTDYRIIIDNIKIRTKRYLFINRNI